VLVDQFGLGSEFPHVGTGDVVKTFEQGLSVLSEVGKLERVEQHNASVVDVRDGPLGVDLVGELDVHPIVPQLLGMLHGGEVNES